MPSFIPRFRKTTENPCATCQNLYSVQSWTGNMPQLHIRCL